MSDPFDVRQSARPFDQTHTLVAVIERSQARWLRAQGIEAYVIHAASVAVSREHRRAKTDRLDIAMLKHAFLGSAHAARSATAPW